MRVEVQVDSELSKAVKEAASEAPPGIDIRLEEDRALRDGGVSLLVFALVIGKDVGVGIASAWLYDWLKAHASNIRIDGTAVPITEDQLKASVEKDKMKPAGP